MIYGYARLSTDGQSVTAQVAELTKAGCDQVLRETADALLVTRLDRLDRSTRYLLNTLAAIADGKAGFRSLGDATTAHGWLMLTALGGLAEFERELIRSRTGEGRARAVARRVKLSRKPNLWRTK